MTAMTGETQKQGRPKARIGLALGGGAARGWAHIGVIEVLGENGIAPDIVCGCSMGSLVGAAYVTGRIGNLSDWVKKLAWPEILSLIDVGFSGGGLIRGEKLLRFLREKLADIDIVASPIPYAAIATDLETGAEVWLQEGSLFDAVHASIAIPGVFDPVQLDGRWLVDGGLVDPVPVSPCRALGADYVIAINVNGEMPRKAWNNDTMQTGELVARLRSLFGRDNGNSGAGNRPARPGYLSTASAALYIMQDRIARARLAGDPPNIVLTPPLGHIGLHEFDRAAEAIELGRKCALDMLPALNDGLTAMAGGQGD
jgi:NTE family protein